MSLFRGVRRSVGFTLIELLVVIAIVGILAAVVLSSLNDAREQAKIRAAQADMKNIHTAMEMLYNHTGLYPHKLSAYCPPREGGGNEVNLGLPSSGMVATDGNYSAWNGPYIRDVTDPWGREYYFDEDYYCAGGEVGCNGFSTTDADEIWSVLVSCGSDGMLGEDPSNPQPSNGTACAYNDDNIVYPLCKN
jgi:type II secretion system protein G